MNYSKNHINLVSNCPFEELPLWFQKAQTLNAAVEFKDGILIWKQGTWQKGIWQKGIWKQGTWQEGTWQEGIWQEGIWQNGIWESGTWESGTWQKGIWKQGIWQEGVWEEGFMLLPFRCKWKVYYNTQKQLVRIGCKEKSVEDWDKWFASDEVYETPRNDPQFQKIQTAFIICKTILSLMK